MTDRTAELALFGAIEHHLPSGPHTQRATVTFLTNDEAEADAVLASQNLRTWTGRRDHALLAVAAQTGLRGQLGRSSDPLFPSRRGGALNADSG
ncbi:MAG: hypothetical protein WAV54_00480 [Acidimicrobiales bacterium]